MIQLANGDQRVAVATDAEYPSPFDEDNNTSKPVAARIRFYPGETSHSEPRSTVT